jgi:HK97 family phage portal protein
LGIISSLFESRASVIGSAPPRDPVIAEWFSSGRPTLSGQSVSYDSAKQTSAVYACIKILAESLASLPLILYRTNATGGRDRATDLPLYSVLRSRPNKFQTAFEFREMLMGHCALRGNAYAEIIMTPARSVDQLIPRHPDRITPFWAPDGTIAYSYQDTEGPRRTIMAFEMLHIRTLSDDGLLGESPIKLQKESLGLLMATEEHGARLFSQGTQVAGVLEHPGKLSDEAAKRLRESWEARYSGMASVGKTAILEEGMKFTKLGMTAEDSQFLQTRQYQLEEIARIFRIPLVLLQHGDKTSTYASAEQFFLSFVVDTLGPWLIRWEQAIGHALLDDSPGLYVEHLIDSRMRADTGSRYASYSIGRQWGWLSVNDIYMQPANMNPIGSFATPNAGDIPSTPKAAA